MSAREHLPIEYDQKHPGIDAIVDEHLPHNDYYLRSSSNEDGREYILMQENDGRASQHIDLPSKEMNALDKEGKATFIIHKLKSMQSFKRGFLLFLPILFIIIVASFVFLHFGLGLDLPNDDLLKILYTLFCTALCIPPLLAIIGQERRRTDLDVHAIRPDIVKVFRTIASLQESERKRQGYLRRAKALEF